MVVSSNACLGYALVALIHHVSNHLWLQPSLGHGAFDNVPLNPSAMRAGKEAHVSARLARLNRRQLHWRTAVHCGP
jgi:hypothetical protein